jgi:UDP-N-acetylmuramate: L-alanyl-gamma-D-glutamyl-meso-diaminopimelate ligase
MHVHLLGVCGTGMGSLAALLLEAGHRVSGSDTSFDPPMGPMLRDLGVTLHTGWDRAHVSADTELTVVGNVIRRTNPAAEALDAEGAPRTSMSGALRKLFLSGKKPLVVCGTHGKTTTTTMATTVLREAGLEPGWFIGGRPKGLPASAAIGGKRRLVAPQGAPGSTGAVPFCIEGDEYDAVYWHKEPKFLDYVGVAEDDVVIVTSVEHDHADIYPTVEAYENAFARLFAALPPGGLAVVDAREEAAVRLAQAHARCRVVFYGLESDRVHYATPEWLGARAASTPSGAQTFDLYAGGMACGRFELPAPGDHNMRNAIAAVAACTQGFGVSMAAARTALARFGGVARRQDVIGEPGGITVIDDFAHHPTAVDETLRALRAAYTGRRLVAVFEPRSATACRSIHQESYARAFGAADEVFFAPLGRSTIAPEERLDLDRLAKDLGSRAHVVPSLEELENDVLASLRTGDVVAFLSNGAFGGVPQKVLAVLKAQNKSS